MTGLINSKHTQTLDMLHEELPNIIYYPEWLALKGDLWIDIISHLCGMLNNYYQFKSLFSLPMLEKVSNVYNKYYWYWKTRIYDRH
jgi:hypothetical protein